MKRITLLIVLIIACFSSCRKKHHPNTVQTVTRPKIVIGIVIDQMRWDYLYRFYNMYGNEGFRRLMREGYNCQNTMLNYLPSFTGPGHTCIYTGSVPSIHGIAGNNWIDNKTGANVYCVDDKTVHLVSDPTKAPSMSPANLMTTTITDELRLATNQKSRVYGVALKDRGSILPAGHLANAAYWYNDKTGTFTTSSYYPNQNPKWLQVFNKSRIGDSLVKRNWKLLYTPEYYSLSTTDANNYEQKFKNEAAPVFLPVKNGSRTDFQRRFDTLPEADRNSVIKSIPAGNTFSIMMAKACMEGENLGFGDETDFMALSLSSTDYAGHQFGPNSIEVEDMYLHLDKDIAAFLKYLDLRYGQGNYLFFLTADHGGAHNATYLSDLDIPSGVENQNFMANINGALKAQFGRDSIVIGLDNYQVSLNESMFSNAAPAKPADETPAQFKTVKVKTGRGRHARIKEVQVRIEALKAPVAAKLDRDRVKQAIMQWLATRPEVAYTMDMENPGNTLIPEPIREMVVNGYYRPRSGVIQIILNPGWYDNGGRTTGTTHGTWNPYDTHIPLLWYGWHIPAGETHEVVNMTDISATLAALLHIQMPNGCIGKPITSLADWKPEHKRK